jgi:serine/threonine-protein kinase
MANPEKPKGDADKAVSYHPCPTCGLPFNSAIVVCPNDGAVIRPNQALRNSLLSRYEFLSEAGVGGAGIVYKAKQKSTGKLVAIKMVSLDNVNKDSVARFQAEANACSRLVHENLIRMHDYGITELGQPYIVLEFIDGIDLSEMLKRAGGVGLGTALDIAEQLTCGLQRAHAENILHRDLKPGNIMVIWKEGRPIVKIVDFSIAKLEEEPKIDEAKLTSGSSEPIFDGPRTVDTPLDPVREIVGTPAYMSPEQIMGKPLDQRSDLYSLGCVLFEMFTGTPPFMGKNAVQIVFKQLNEPAESLSKVAPGRNFTPSLQSIVDKLLSKDMNERYKTAGDLLDDLRAAKAEIDEREKPVPRGRRELSVSSKAKQTPEKSSNLTSRVVGIVALIAACVCAWILADQAKERLKSAPIKKIQLHHVKSQAGEHSAERASEH